MKPGSGCSGQITGKDGSELDVVLVSAGASPATGKLRLLLYNSRQPGQFKRYLGHISKGDDTGAHLRLTGLSKSGVPATEKPQPLLLLDSSPTLDLNLAGTDVLEGQDETGEYTLHLTAGLSREWTSKGGKSVTAELVGFEGNAAVFRRPGGKTSNNDLDVFADADVTLLRKLRDLHRTVRSEEEGDGSDSE